MSVSMLSQQPRLRALLHFSTFSLVLSLQPPCGHNWISSHQSGSCIWFFNDQLNYHDARQSCQSKGGDLLKILDSSMNDFLFSAFRLGNGGVYIGLSNIYGGYFYTWLGSIAEVNLFGSSMFNPPKSGTFCVQLNINSTHKKGWKAIGCDKTGSYICEKYPVKLCDPGWIPSPHSGTCIKLYSNEMRWDFARTACQRKGADLAMIFNEAQTSFISEQRRHHSDVKKYWIGLKRPSNGASYRWLDYADKVVFTQWANNTSIPSTGYPCVALIEDIVWSSFSCHEIAGYVCEKFSDCRYRQYGMLCPADCSTTHCKGKARACNPRSGVCTHGCEIGYSGPTCILGSCPTGWTLSPHSGTCLAFAYTKTDWISAKKGCREDNGDLVIITDDSMNQFIWDQISPYASAPYWIGLNDRAVEGKFQWMDYIEQVTYTNWDVSEPKNRLGTEDCASINSFGAKTMKWSSDNCDMKANFICETYADCKKKSFGMVCPKTCSLYCMNQDCNRRTGSCSFGCKFGYGGSNCNICLLISYENM